MQGHDYEICYSKGPSNSNADCLSRREYSNSESISEPEDAVISVGMNYVDSQSENQEPVEVCFVYTTNPTTPSLPNVFEVAADTEVDLVNITQLQTDCPDFKHIYSYLSNGTLPEDNKLSTKVIQETSQYDLLDGILYHFYQPRTRGRKKDVFGKQLVCPQEFRNDVLQSYHNIGHFGFDRTYLALKQKFVPMHVSGSSCFYQKV